MRTTFKKYQLFILAFFISSTQYAQSFTNPILSGYYPDPSICKAGEDYYIVNSSFAHYPGLPVLHSKDLLNWQLVGYALDRPEQLNLEGRGAGVSRGLFAPAIAWHKGTFYIVCTNVSGVGNFVITAKDPKGPWSNPVKLPEVNGIDPSLFFDDNDKAYIVYNSIPPNDETMWNGHRSIRMYQFDADNLKIKGEQILLVNGGTDVTQKPVWIEGPHIYKIKDWYYLMCAQGGTGYNHTEVVFRSKNVYGPYWPYEKNPILTQMHLNPRRPNPITTTGHADLVEDKDGNWWGVFLGCRPYEGDYYNTGRETFMAPVKWTEDGWPVFNLGGDEVKYQYPINAIKNPLLEPLNGNYTFKDEFKHDKLSLRYRFLRTVKENWYSLSENKEALTIQLRKETISGSANPSFVGFAQPHLKGYAATAVKFWASAPNEKAGLTAMQNETHFYYLAQSVKEGKPVVELYKDSTVIASKSISLKKGKNLFLKIEANNGTYSFYYATQESKWQLLLAGADGKYLSTKGAGGFVGCLYAMYATSSGQDSGNKAVYDWFEIKNDDDVYKQ